MVAAPPHGFPCDPTCRPLSTTSPSAPRPPAGRRFSLGLCSLTGHQLAGEERFQVELHADGSVLYDIFLFSRPDTLLAWASLPVVKVQQVRYVLGSLGAVQAAVRQRVAA